MWCCFFYLYHIAHDHIYMPILIILKHFIYNIICNITGCVNCIGCDAVQNNNNNCKFMNDNWTLRMTRKLLTYLVRSLETDLYSWVEIMFRASKQSFPDQLSCSGWLTFDGKWPWLVPWTSQMKFCKQRWSCIPGECSVVLFLLLHKLCTVLEKMCPS